MLEDEEGNTSKGITVMRLRVGDVFIYAYGHAMPMIHRESAKRAMGFC